MTDTNHIEMLRKLRGEADEWEVIEGEKAALDAAIQSLSARASAGEGGEWTKDAREWGSALNEAAWTFMDVCPEKSALLWNTGKSALRDAILKYAECVAAPQPAQAGASGVPAELRSRNDESMSWAATAERIATPASAATEDGPDSFDCPHAHAARVCGCGFCRALNSDRYAFGAPQPAAPQPQEAPVQEPSNARKPDECANGCPPQQVCDYCQIATPPAHGDGEGDACVIRLGPNDWNPYELLDIARLHVPTKDPGDALLLDRIHECLRQQRFTQTHDATRPTPEAQEARDAARLDFITAVPGQFSTVPQKTSAGNYVIHMQGLGYFHGATAREAIDAALALPAQGEG